MIGAGVVPGARGRGLGRALLRALLEHAQRASIARISLSVSPENFARQLYESLGFRKVGVVGDSWTMVRTLTSEG